jgi:hypothetical protein
MEILISHQDVQVIKHLRKWYKTDLYLTNKYKQGKPHKVPKGPDIYIRSDIYIFSREILLKASAHAIYHSDRLPFRTPGDSTHTLSVAYQSIFSSIDLESESQHTGNGHQDEAEAALHGASSGDRRSAGWVRRNRVG